MDYVTVYSSQSLRFIMVLSVVAQYRTLHTRQHLWCSQRSCSFMEYRTQRRQ